MFDYSENYNIAVLDNGVDLIIVLTMEIYPVCIFPFTRGHHCMSDLRSTVQ